MLRRIGYYVDDALKRLPLSLPKFTSLRSFICICINDESIKVITCYTNDLRIIGFTD